MFERVFSDVLPDAVYRDLLSTLFSMKLVIGGFGLLYVAVGLLIYLKEGDAVIAALAFGAVAVTIARVLAISGYYRAGGAEQRIADLKRWESRYAILTYIFAALLAGLNVRALTMHEPMIPITTISLVFHSVLASFRGMPAGRDFVPFLLRSPLCRRRWRCLLMRLAYQNNYFALNSSPSKRYCCSRLPA